MATYAIAGLALLASGVLFAHRLSAAEYGMLVYPLLRAFAGLAALAIAARGRTPGERALALALAITAVQGWRPAIVALSGTPPDSSEREALQRWLHAADSPRVAAMWVVTIRALQLFPRPVDSGQARRVAPRAWGRVLSALLSPAVLWFGLGTAILLASLARSWTVGGAVALVSSALCFGYARAGLTSAGEKERRSIHWLAFAAGTFMLTAVAGTALLFALAAIGLRDEYAPTLQRAVFTVNYLVGVSAGLLAVFGPAGLDPRRWLRHTTSNGLAASGMLLAFALLENLLTGAAAQRLGIGGSVVTAGIATLLALAFMPLHRVLTRASDRLLVRLLPLTSLAEGPRRTMVVVFSDLVGYSALAAESEREALVLLTVFHRVARRVAEAHGGRLVKTVGDAVLLAFGPVPNAVECVRELGEELRRAGGVVGLPPPRIRTGVHVGEVALGPDGDVFGDAVNVAARLQSAAEPDEVLFSAAAAEQAGRPPDLEAAGPRVLKNIPVPLETYRIRGQAIA